MILHRAGKFKPRVSRLFVRAEAGEGGGKLLFMGLLFSFLFVS